VCECVYVWVCGSSGMWPPGWVVTAPTRPFGILHLHTAAAFLHVLQPQHTQLYMLLLTASCGLSGLKLAGFCSVGC
jgi:hypothetical protein